MLIQFYHDHRIALFKRQYDMDKKFTKGSKLCFGIVIYSKDTDISIVCKLADLMHSS